MVTPWRMTQKVPALRGCVQAMWGLGVKPGAAGPGFRKRPARGSHGLRPLVTFGIRLGFFI